MESTINRLEKELDLWKKRELRLSKIFPSNLLESRPFKQEKLKHFHILSIRFGSPQNKEEQLSLQLLNQECKSLEREIHPNWWIRMLSRVLNKINLLSMPAKVERQSASNISHLKAQLDEYGFGLVKSQLDQQVKQGNQSFDLPLSYYINDKERINFQLYFSKNSIEQYNLTHYNAALTVEGQRGKSFSRDFAINSDMKFTATQAANLLSGRAVMKERHGQSYWMKLDFCDADKEGNFKMKTFPPEYGYNLKAVLNRLKLRAGQENVLEQLKDGFKVKVKLSKYDQQILIEADPQKRSLLLHNQSGKKLTLEALDIENSKRRKVQVPLSVKEDAQQIEIKKVKGRKL